MLNYCKFKLITLLILCSTMFTLTFVHTPTAQAVNPITARGTENIQYWMEHVNLWPLNVIALGDSSYTKEEAIKIMESAQEMDRSYRLATEMIAAKLNIAAGNDSTCLTDLLVLAEQWFTENPAGSSVSVLDIPWKMEGMNLHAIFGEYNDGLLCAPSRHAIQTEHLKPGIQLTTLYGLIQSFPGNLEGEWLISDIQIMADTETSFQAIKTEFDVDTMVEVLFYIDDDGVKRAAKIITHYRNAKGKDTYSPFESAEGHAFGVLTERPETVDNLLGIWMIGGIDYRVIDKTRFSGFPFEEKLEIDTAIQVRYYLDEAGNRIAKQIMPARGIGQTRTPGRHVVAGFLNKLAQFEGDSWNINNIEFASTNDVELDESLGIFANNTYVTAEYVVEQGKRKLHRLKTHVPPDAGDKTNQGIIDGIGSDGAERGSRNLETDISSEVWSIDGVNYLVTAATDLDDMDDGILERGELVTINSYTDESGQEVATRIRSVSNNSSDDLETTDTKTEDVTIASKPVLVVYLPIVMR